MEAFFFVLSRIVKLLLKLNFLILFSKIGLMDFYKVEETDETPLIEFNISKRSLLLKGRSIPENPIKFFAPLLTLLGDYHKAPQPFLEVDFKLEYFNTSSAKCILQILLLLSKIEQRETDVVVNWYYDEDDDDIFEIGQDYARIIKIPVNLKMMPNN